MSPIISVTAEAPVNIATIKYWGKRDEQLILPLNDSISVTLSTEHMCARTTVAISPDFLEDKIWLNGKEESISNPRLQNCLTSIKKLANISKEKLEWKVRICSENNFPTAAGLASSAAGYACLVFALAKVYHVEGNTSAIARQGSGSACRSVFGGFVRWYSGTKSDGSDSLAAQLAPVHHWPELKVIILVVNDEQKKTSSTVAMRWAAQTSSFLKYRAKESVKVHIEKMIEAIRLKNFELFAETTMRDSNQFHAVCMDTYPPVAYMNNVSHAIVSFVHEYNTAFNGSRIAYSYDAGPNACLFVLEKDVKSCLAAINKAFPTTASAEDYFKGIPVDISDQDAVDVGISMKPNLLKYIICTEVGKGPVLVDETKSLLNPDGSPRNFRACA